MAAQTGGGERSVFATVAEAGFQEGGEGFAVGPEGVVDGFAGEVAGAVPAQDAGAGGEEELLDFGAAPALPAFAQDELEGAAGGHAAQFGLEEFTGPKAEFALAAFGGGDVEDPGEFTGFHHGADGDGIDAEDGADNIEGDEGGATAEGVLAGGRAAVGGGMLPGVPREREDGFGRGGRGGGGEPVGGLGKTPAIFRMAVGADAIFGAVDDEADAGGGVVGHKKAVNWLKGGKLAGWGGDLAEWGGGGTRGGNYFFARHGETAKPVDGGRSPGTAGAKPAGPAGGRGLVFYTK